MKITKDSLKKIINEELENITYEAQDPEVSDIIKNNPSAKIIYDELRKRNIRHFEIFYIISKAFKQ